MVRITEELVRKRAEHNECEIFSLEELSLHQQDLEKIENLDKWCKHLKILYLQNNLISKIENVGRLKKLEYLNLALNNVEKIENLKGCESLKKLDLTVNFIGDLTSVESLRRNIFFEDLYLTGNPCTQYEGYQEFVIATLPQLRWIDGHEIEKSERIKAIQKLEQLRPKIIAQQNEYFKKREQQKKDELEKQEKKNKESVKESEENAIDLELEHKKNSEFWEEKVEFTPESRLSIQNKMREDKEKKHESKFKKPDVIKRERRLFSEEGKPLNVNEGKLDFCLAESDDDSAFVLDVSCYKFMDTSLIEADVQPWYVRVTMKGAILQLALLEEVKTDSSKAQRSQITGHLIITMPKLYPTAVPALRPSTESNPRAPLLSSEKPRQLLEVSSKPSFTDELASITKKAPNTLNMHQRQVVKNEPENSPDFIDDPSVPPLI